MTRRVRVLGGVTIGRIVAAACTSALLAGAEMNPARADLHTVFAFAADWLLYIIDRADVGARSRSSHSIHPRSELPMHTDAAWIRGSVVTAYNMADCGAASRPRASTVAGLARADA